jgi:hypothetical protein
MNVGILQLELEIPGSMSLKEKRGIVKSLKERIRQRFNVSASEVDLHDVWNRALLGIACVSIDARIARETLDNVLRFAEEHNGSVVSDYTIEVL